MSINWSEMNTTREKIKKRFLSFLMTKSKAWEIVIKVVNFNNKNVLDFGCSQGKFFRFLKSKNIHFYGIGYDIDKSLKYKVKDFKVYFSIEKIKRKVDIVTMFEVIEHMNVSEADKTLNKLSKIIKKNGYLIISTRNVSYVKFPWEFWYDVTHVRPYPPKDLIYIVEKNGFRFLTLIRTECSLNPLLLLFSMILWKDWCGGYLLIFEKR